MVVVAVGRFFMALCQEQPFPVEHSTPGGTRIRLPDNAPAPEFVSVLSGNRKVTVLVGRHIPVAETFLRSH
jgi:hypothetical protein